MDGRRCPRTLAVGALAALGLLAGTLAADDEPGIRWIEDLETARAEAQASGRPLFLVFRCVP